MPFLLASIVANSTPASADIPLQRLLIQDQSNVTLQDEDGDGLDDALEVGLALAKDRVDTDTDGWNDAEELARGSLPGIHCSQPGGDERAIGARAYMSEGRLHAVFGVYVKAGTLAKLNVEIGLRYNQMTIVLPASTYVGRMTITSVPTLGNGELLLVVDVVMPSSPLVRSGSMSIFGRMSFEGQLIAADTVNLVMSDGIPVELITTAQMSPGAEQQLGPGLIHRPLGGTQAPATWSAGEICFQRTNPVGTHGAVVTQEVTSATCVDGWDGHCDGGNCSSSVGTTIDLLDATALIGG